MKTIFVIGDSISIGYGPHLQKMIAYWLDYDRKGGTGKVTEDLDHPEKANGGDSSMVLDYLQDQLNNPNFTPDYFLLNCGLHDIKTDITTHTRQVALPAYQENLKTIKRLILQRGIQLIWVRTTPVNDDIHNKRCAGFHRFAADLDQYNAAADAIMTPPDVSVIDLYHFTRSLGTDDVLFRDHVHYPPEIEAQQAAFIAGNLAAMNASA